MEPQKPTEQEEAIRKLREQHHARLSGLHQERVALKDRIETLQAKQEAVVAEINAQQGATVALDKALATFAPKKPDKS